MTTATETRKYHIARAGTKKAGQWVTCSAKNKCRNGGKHIDETTYQILTSEDRLLYTVEDAFNLADAEMQPTPKAVKKKPKFDKEKWVEEQKELIEKLQGELEQQIGELHTDENWNNYLTQMGKFHKYSWSNQLLISLQKPEATRVAGFRAWKADHERHVKAGEKGLKILAPSFVKKDLLDKNGNKVFDDKGKPKKREVLIGYRTVSVFDVSQTEGKPLPELMTLSETPPAGFKEDLEDAIKKEGYTVSYENIPGEAYGYTTMKGDKRVVISSNLNEGMQATTLAHELGHIAAGHTETANDYHTGKDGRRGAMEVEAESISYVLCRSNGMSPAVGKDNSAGYVAGWAGVQSDDPDVVKNSAKHVAKTVSKLFTSHKWANMPA